MDILRRRPLFLCCAVFMLFSVVALPLNGAVKLTLGATVTGPAVIAACLSWFRRKQIYPAVLLLVAALLACLALLESHMVFQGRTRARLQSLEQTTVSVCATVADRRGTGAYLTAYTLDVDTVNGHPVDGRALLTCHYVSDISPGNEITLDATLIPLSEAALDGYDEMALLGDGYIMGLLSEDETSVAVTKETSTTLSARVGNLRRTLAARLNLLTGRESHGLPSALLLGDKTALSDSTRRDFSRAGASHMLAISGLHVALLFGLLEGFLRLLYVPKRARIAVMGLGAVAYLILLGFPPSATRAVIMLGMTCLAYYSNGRADSLTSLGLAGCLILAVTPQAVADAGFWMSFLATMGLITLTPLLRTGLARLDHRDASAVSRRLRRYGTKLLTALAVGIVAVSFVLLVVTAVIGEMSILSPISTLLLTPFCGVIPVLSLLALPLTGTSVGVLLGNTVGGISSLMADLAARLAQPSWTVISLRHPAVLPIAVGMTAATLVLLVIRLPVRRRAAVVLPILVGWISLGGVLTAHAYLTRHEIRTTYLQPSAVSEALVLVSGNRGVVCDLSNGSLSAMTAAAREAELQGATELAACVLTHYHSRTSGALATFLERETVRALWMPTPTDPETYYRMLACLEQAEAAGVEVRLYDKGQALTLFGESRLILETSELARSVQPVLLISLDVPHKDGSPGTEGDHRLVYCGSAVFESDLSSRAAEWVGEADTVILGGHGPLCKAPFGREADFTRAREIILSAFGETADYFAPAELSPDTTLWLGQKRMVLP